MQIDNKVNAVKIIKDNVSVIISGDKKGLSQVSRSRLSTGLSNPVLEGLSEVVFDNVDNQSMSQISNSRGNVLSLGLFHLVLTKHIFLKEKYSTEIKAFNINIYKSLCLLNKRLQSFIYTNDSNFLSENIISISKYNGAKYNNLTIISRSFT